MKTLMLLYIALLATACWPSTSIDAQNNTNLTNPRHRRLGCGVAATEIRPSSAPREFRAYDCVNPGTVPIYVGSESVTTSDYGSKICNSAATCARNSVGASGSGEYCISTDAGVTDGGFEDDGGFIDGGAQSPPPILGTATYNTLDCRFFD